LDGYVGTNVGTSECKLGFGTVPELGTGDFDALPDGSNWEAVYIVETRVCSVGSNARASTGARFVDAAFGVESGRCRVGGACFRSVLLQGRANRYSSYEPVADFCFAGPESTT
jgi:hypothetical protein